MTEPVKISPSDTTFLWNECRRCFQRKVRYGVRAPGIFPRVFGMLDRQQREWLDGKPAATLDPSLGEGVLDCRERAVKSRPLDIPGAPAQVFVSGRIDAMIRFADGAVGVVDFKTTADTAERAEALYWPQLHAYARAFEQPASAYAQPLRVSRIGLFLFEPDGIEDAPGGPVQRMRTTWAPVRRRDAEFDALLREMAIVARTKEPLPGSERCGVCAFLRRAAV